MFTFSFMLIIGSRPLANQSVFVLLSPVLQFRQYFNLFVFALGRVGDMRLMQIHTTHEHFEHILGEHLG